VENILLTMERESYAKVNVKSKPGLMLKLSKSHVAERLPKPIEGLHAFIHSGSAGHLELEEFKTYLEASLNSSGVSFRKYD
jgi:hypothetical protein